MTAAPLYRVDIMPAQDVHGYGATAGRVAGDHLPLRKVRDHKLAAPALLNTDRVVKADVTHQDMEVVVVVPDRGCIRRTMSVSLQYSVGGLRVNRVAVDVYYCQAPGLLLGDTEDVALKARRLNPYHIGISLEKIAGKHEHIADLVHRFPKVGAALCIVAVNVEIGNAGYFIGSQGDFLIVYLRHFEIAVGGRYLRIVLHCPVEDGTELVAHRFDGGRL